MRLNELEPRFLKIIDERTWRDDAPISDCDGLFFLCPVCFQANNGSIGTHAVICWKPTVPQAMTPGPGRWDIRGSSFEDLSLVAGSSSVKLNSGCNAHFHVTNGEIKLA